VYRQSVFRKVKTSRKEYTLCMRLVGGSEITGDGIVSTRNVIIINIPLRFCLATI